MSHTHTIKTYFLYTPLVLTLFIATLVGSAMPAMAQSQNTVEITEIMYSSVKSGDWLEIIADGTDTVTITELSIQVDNDAKQSISTHGSTKATLSAGKSAVIVQDAALFSTTYGSSVGGVYTADISLPEGATIKLYQGETVIDTITYTQDYRAEDTGMSLHLTTENDLIVAPATPGEVAINPPDTAYTLPSPIGFSVITSAVGGEETNEGIFVGVGDTITLELLHERDTQTPTATFHIGSDDVGSVNFSGEDSVRKEASYTLPSTSMEGVVTYTIHGLTDDSGTALTKSGTVAHDGKQVIFDSTPPTVSVTIEPTGTSSYKEVILQVADTYLTDTVFYKTGTVSCATKAEYVASRNVETTISLVNGEARFSITDPENNGKKVCVRAVDKGGNEYYTTSPQISGIVQTAVRITEISYNSSEGDEWIEIVNDSSAVVNLADLKVVEGGQRRAITHVSGDQTIASGEVAIITGNAEAFRLAFGAYTGPLYTSTFALNDPGDTIVIQKISTGEELYSISYTSNDGAKKDSGKTLHISSTRTIFEATPTPGSLPGDQGVISGGGGGTAKEVRSDIPHVTITTFNGNPVTSGKNLFFTTENTVTFQVTIADSTTNYSRDTITTYLEDVPRIETEASARFERVSVSNAARGAVVVQYRIHFSPENGVASDNRVFIRPKVSDGDGNVSSVRDSIVVVRNTQAPQLTLGTNAQTLGFYGNKVIIPVSVASLTMGDWAQLNYDGSCDIGSLPYLVRNGSHGIHYKLSEGTFADCTLTAVDSAHNESNTQLLPRIFVTTSSL